MTVKLRRFATASAALIIIAFSIALLSHAQTENLAHPTQAGRFQIYELRYQGGLSSNTRTDVFRIDSQTGETWKYISFVTDDRKPVDLWQKIGERTEAK
jgi:hypothetical protein